MARLTRGERIMNGVWSAVESMIAPELDRYRKRYPKSRRRALLETMHQAALTRDEEELTQAGGEYMKLTSLVPPGCYAICDTRSPSHYLTGERIPNRKRGEIWRVYRHSPQVNR